MEYADFLIGQGNVEKGINILNAILEDKLSDEQRLRLYGIYRYGYRVAGNDQKYTEYNEKAEHLLHSLDILNGDSYANE